MNSKILIVVDDETSRFLLEEILSGLNPEILITNNGLDAVEICRANPDIDVIFMDIKIPKLSGYEATKQIISFNKSVIIFAQTAYGFSADKDKAIKLDVMPIYQNHW